MNRNRADEEAVWVEVGFRFKRSREGIENQTPDFYAVELMSEI